MKKLLLASAVAALSVSAAHAAPTVYGKAFLILDYASGDKDVNTKSTNTPQAGGASSVNEKNEGTDTDSTKLNSKSSRIGVKGSEALTADTDVIYQLEYGVDVDAADNGDDQFYSRDTYLGLKNEQYGTFVAGRLTTIDDYVDFADVLEGKNVAKKAGPSFDEPRVDNAFAYMSPDYDGVQVLAMYALDTDQDYTNNEDNTDHDQYGLAATYTTGPMNIGASYIVGGKDLGFARISGNYEVSPQLVVGAMYQNGDYDTDDNENTFVLSAEMDTGTNWTTYGQINMVDNVKGASDDEALGIGVGGKYKFTKAATGHVYLGYLDKESTKTKSYSKDINNVMNDVYEVKTTEEDGFGIGAGLEYKF